MSTSTNPSTNPLGPWGQNQPWGSLGTTWGEPPLLSLPAEYYLNLFTSQYRTQPNLNAATALLIKPLQDAALVLQLMATTAFDLNYAVGVQLDCLGEWQGVSRTVPFQPSNSVSPVLDDTTYRLLIRATILANHWNGTLPGLITIWQTLFPGGSLAVDDGFNMTATLLCSGGFTSIIKDLITNGMILPRSQSVQYTISFPTLPVFGCDNNNAYIAGVDVGHIT